MSHRPNNHGERIGALEGGFKSLGNELHGLRDSFDSFAIEMRRNHQELQRAQAARERTQWAPIIAAVAVVVSVIGGLVTLGANGPLRDLSRHDQQLDRVVDKIDSISRSRFTSDDGKMLDASLQREMRDLDRVSASRIDALDEMLQREMRLLVKPVEERLRLMETRVEEHQKDGHPEWVVQKIEGIEHRVRMLESTKQ